MNLHSSSPFCLILQTRDLGAGFTCCWMDWIIFAVDWTMLFIFMASESVGFAAGVFNSFVSPIPFAINTSATIPNKMILYRALDFVFGFSFLSLSSM